MRRRSAPPPSAQQMIREYLGRVSVAATKVLPKGDRLLFVGRTRAAIEAKVGPLASADADAVQNALTTMGDPEDLAKRERERLYSARRRGAAAAPPALWKPSKESRRGASGSRRGAVPPPAREQGPSPGRRRPRPWPHRGLTGPDEPQPAETASQPVPREPVPAVPPQADSPEAFPCRPGCPRKRYPARGCPRNRRSRKAARGSCPGEPPRGTGPHGTGARRFSGGRGECLRGRPACPGSGRAGSGHTGARAQAEPDTPGEAADARDAGRGATRIRPEQNGTPPGWLHPGRPTPAPAPGEAEPLSIVPGMSESGEPEDHPVAGRRSVAGWRSPVVAFLAEAWALARKHPLEAVAVVLLGLGGLILPFPFWLIGGLVALRSRRWDARDKWIALAGPPLVTFLVLLIRAVTSHGNFFSAFYHASQHDVGLSIRVGCVLCAGYLIWRLRRGPRLRTLPPWQRPR